MCHRFTSENYTDKKKHLHKLSQLEVSLQIGEYLYKREREKAKDKTLIVINSIVRSQEGDEGKSLWRVDYK